MNKEKILTFGLIFGSLVLALVAVVTAWRLKTLEPVAPTVPQAQPKAANSACKLSFSVNPPTTPTPTGVISPTPSGILTPTPSLPFSPTPTPTGSITPSPTPTTTQTPTLTLTPSLTPSPSPTSKPMPTPTPLPGCYHECSSDNDCEGTLRCQSVSGVKRCVNLTCPGEPDCICNKNCWEICGQDRECPENLRCRSIDGTYRCVNQTCEREQDCDCVVPTSTPTSRLVVVIGSPTPQPTGPTPTPIELPPAGISLPTLGAIAGGIILTIVSLLLAL